VEDFLVEITGEVDQKERSQMVRPGVVKPDPNTFTNIPVLRLRVINSAGRPVQILYKGEAPGDMDIGDQVVVQGIEQGGIIHARSIYNSTTESWVTSPPGWLERLLSKFS
jgi:hypothetical protein